MSRFNEFTLVGGLPCIAGLEGSVWSGAMAMTSCSTISLSDAAEWVLEAAKKLDAFSNRQRGWDSYDGLPLSPRSREFAFDTLTTLRTQDLPTPSVVLGSAGTIQFEWRRGGKELEVDLGEGDAVEYVTVDRNGNIDEGIVTEGWASRLLRLSGWFLYG